MFNVNRVFSARNGTTGQVEWFFEAREGIMGPYESAASANKALGEFKERCMRLGCSGGRTDDPKLGFKPLQSASASTTMKLEIIKKE